MSESTGTEPQWSPEEIERHIAAIKGIVEKEKAQYGNDNFTGITEEEIRKKFERVNSPMIIFQGWSGSTTPGGVINYNVGIYNPDPVASNALFAHVFVGSGNVDPTVGTFLLNVDERFPRLTEPPFAGLSLAPGANTTLSFALQVPPSVQKTNYLGNTCLMRFNWHDVGTYLDRSVFPFRVV